MTAKQKLDTLSDAKLLVKVDQLRDLSLSQHVPLPQLVVVGDQSSGKSSLLESLTGIPFPKDQTLCTRHVTQITCRRDKDEHVDIRIIAGPHASDDDKKHVESFSKQVKSASDFRQQFESILTSAHERMGLRADTSHDKRSVFSEDILKIQVHGPEEDYLTIIDVPGIFRTTTEGTSKDDMVLVKDIVKRYIKDRRTIILAVLPSNVDIATQEILELAEDYDKDGERTLGVLTKPDLVLEPTAQAAVCDLVQGKRRPLNLGYFLVRNRGTASGTDVESELDQMFRKQPWVDLPQERLGILALREQLRVLLIEITQREFPKLIQEVSNQMKRCKEDLNNLGPPRHKEREQRSFLSRIAGSFQDRARAALTADYSADPVFDQHGLRLITRVVNITEIFSADFQRVGHSRHFHNFEQPAPSAEDDSSSEEEYESSTSGSLIENLRQQLKGAALNDFTPEETTELGDILVPSQETPMPQDGVTAWINDIYLQSRGQDLGTFNANLVLTAFAEQSRKWGEMTRLYMSRIILTLHRFIADALRSLCPDNQSHYQLWSAILESLVERYRKAMNQAALLIEVEQRKQPYTLNRQLSEALSKTRGYRIKELLRPKARQDIKQYGELQYMVNLDDIAHAAEHKSNMEQLQEEIHDILRAYYGIALERFIDNVFQLAVDYSLLRGPSSPLNVFTHDWVINLEPKKLERIIGEAEATKKRRSKLAKKLSDLNHALQILKE